MNKGKQPVSNRIYKKIVKTVKKDLKSGEDSPGAPVLRRYPTEQEMLEHRPIKKAKIQKDHALSMQKSMHRKKTKAESKHSKRTNTEMSIENSSPASVHKEGSRWYKTLLKQAKVRVKQFVKKSAKRK